MLQFVLLKTCWIFIKLLITQAICGIVGAILVILVIPGLPVSAGFVDIPKVLILPGILNNEIPLSHHVQPFPCSIRKIHNKTRLKTIVTYLLHYQFFQT